MSSLNEVVTGFKKYVDAEILPKVTGWNKWVLGAGVSLMLENSANVFNQLKENPFIKNMGVISKEYEIDIEKLYSVFLEQSKKSAVTFAVPLKKSGKDMSATDWGRMADFYFTADDEDSSRLVDYYFQKMRNKMKKTM